MLTRLLLAGVLLTVFPLTLAAQDKAAGKAAETTKEVSRAAPTQSSGGEVIQKVMSWERFSTIFIIALLILIVALLMMIRSDLERYHTKPN